MISRLVDVDENNEWAYFVAMDDRKNPYKESLYRTSLKENKIEKIIESANSIMAFELVEEDTLQIINSSISDYIHQQEVYLTDGTFVEAKWSADMTKAKEVIDSRYIIDWHNAPDSNAKIKSVMLVPNNLDITKKHYRGNAKSTSPDSTYAHNPSLKFNENHRLYEYSNTKCISNVIPQ